MNGLKAGIKALFKSQRGETLMEGIVSLLILSILLMGVGIMINTSLRITEKETHDAKVSQDAANSAVVYDPDTSVAPPLTFTLEGSTEQGYEIDVQLDVHVNATPGSSDFITYAP